MSHVEYIYLIILKRVMCIVEMSTSVENKTRHMAYFVRSRPDHDADSKLRKVTLKL